MKRLARTRMVASASAARCSALPWPYGWPGSAGRPATPTAKNVRSAATRSVPEWIASETSPRLPLASPAPSLSAIRTRAAPIETSAVRRCGLTVDGIFTLAGNHRGGRPTRITLAKPSGRQPLERRAGGVEPAHAVDASARRRRRRAQVEPIGGGGVRIQAYGRPRVELTKVLEAAVDVPADVVRVACLYVGRAHGVPREDQVAEARSKALDLRLHPFRHVHGRPVRDMAVRPEGVLSGRGPRLVEEALLRDDHVRPLRRLAAPDGVLGLDDLSRRAADVHGSCARALLRRPRHGAVERPIELEHTGAVAVAAQRPQVAIRQPVARGADYTLRRQVEKGHHGRRELVYRGDRPSGLHLAVQRPEVGDECVGDRLRSPAGHGPAVRVAEQGEDEPERRRWAAAE